MKRNLARYSTLCSLAFFGVSLCLCGCQKAVTPKEKVVPAMGTALSVTVPSGDDTSLGMASYLAEGIAGNIQKLIDETDPSSNLSKLNDVGHSIRMTAEQDVYRMLRLAKEYGQQTSGTFDISTVPMEEPWGFGQSPIPTAPLRDRFIKAHMVGVGTQHLRLHPDRLVSFTSPRTRIRLSELARAYAVDMSIRDIRKKGIPSALVNLGGHYIRALGEAGHGQPWRVPLFNPLDPGELLGEVSLPAGMALASRHRLENFVTIEGKRYSGILDPRTGRPVVGTAAAFVLGPTATEAHALATALLVLGIFQAPDVVNHFPRCSLLMIPDQKPLELWMWGTFDETFAMVPAYSESVRFLTAGPSAAPDDNAIDPDES